MKEEKYKLYIWHDILRDHTSGMGFAVARNIKEARNAIKDTCLKDKDRKWEWSSYKGELMNDPEIRELPAGDWLSGGG
jgi:hypothetical protein